MDARDRGGAGAVGGGARSGEHAAEYAALARLLLRSEGVTSPFIEGVSAHLAEIELAEQRQQGGHTPAGWIAANLAALAGALEFAYTEPLTVR